MNAFRAALLLALMCHALDAPGEDGQGNFALKGVGLLTCKAFVADLGKKSAADFAIAGWIQGYLTAYNKHVPDTYDITPFESVGLLLALIKNHCDSHPDDRLYPILHSILIKLHPDRAPKRSHTVQIQGEKRSISLYSETVRRMQAELARRGHYEGDMSGEFSEQTRSALTAFQSEIGVAATGFPDQRTLWKLLRK